MQDRIYMTDCKVISSLSFVEVFYSNGDSFFILTKDWNRCFGAIINGDYETVKKEFSVYSKGDNFNG